MVDYSQRVGYLLALEGGNISALAERTGVSRRTLRRMITGKQSVGGRNQRQVSKFGSDARNRINRRFRRLASDRAKRDEKKARGKDKDQIRILPELVDEATARRLFRSLERLGLNPSVSAQISVAYKDDDGEIPLELVETQFATLYTQGIRQPSVDDAKDNLSQVLTSFINADHRFHGNSPTRLILDPLPNGDPDEGSSYVEAFLYRVYQPLREA